MTTISIHVPPYVAQAFEKAEDDVKKRAENFINAWLNDFLSKKSPNEQLFELMKKATAEAKSKGFSSDNLDDLLKDE